MRRMRSMYGSGGIRRAGWPLEVGGHQLSAVAPGDFRPRPLTITLLPRTICPSPAGPARRRGTTSDVVAKRRKRAAMGVGGWATGRGRSWVHRRRRRRRVCGLASAGKSACLLMERKPPARRLPRPGAAVLAPGRSYKTPEGFPGRSRLHASSEERKRPAVEKRERERRR